jgi:hypothetical protein
MMGEAFNANTDDTQEPCPPTKHRTWVGTIYEDELMPEMTDAEYDEWYARSYIVDGVRVGPLTKEYRLKQLFALREHAFEELQVYDLEIEKLLDEQAMEFRKMRSDVRECDHAFTEGERHCIKCGVIRQGVA